jgi:hypothetical protein
LGKRWNRLLQALRRGEATPKRNGVRVPQPVQYFRVYETQSRGALHIHVAIVSDSGSPIVFSPRKLRALLIRHGFGHEMKWDPMTGGKHELAKRERSKVGGYLAKYLAKSMDERAAVPWRAPGADPDKGRRCRWWMTSRRWRCRMLDIRRRSVPRRHDVEGERSESGFAEGEPLDSLTGDYTVERAPPPCARGDLTLFTLGEGRGWGSVKRHAMV